MDIGNKLYELRKSKNLSQEELADKLNVTRQTISKWETNQSTPDFDKILPLCELYGISADELLKGEKTENIETNDKINPKKRALGISIGIFTYLIAIGFIMISIPVLKMNPVVAAAIFLLICGIATVIIVMSCVMYKSHIKKEKVLTEKEKHVKQICDIIAIIVLILYLLISFLTMAWHITWIIWIIYALIEKIIQLIFNVGGWDNE